MIEVIGTICMIIFVFFMFVGFLNQVTCNHDYKRNGPLSIRCEKCGKTRNFF